LRDPATAADILLRQKMSQDNNKKTKSDRRGRHCVNSAQFASTWLPGILIISQHQACRS
jgi:hypothetical protein